jgi:hypothetical protein
MLLVDQSDEEIGRHKILHLFADRFPYKLSAVMGGVSRAEVALIHERRRMCEFAGTLLCVWISVKESLKLLRRKRSRILYLDHVENNGRRLFAQIVRIDLEGMVAKRKNSPYRVTEKPSPYWIKIYGPTDRTPNSQNGSAKLLNHS